MLQKELVVDQEPSYDDEQEAPKQKKKGFPSIDSLGAKPSAGNPGYGVSSVFDDEINSINDLSTPFKNYQQSKTRAHRLMEILNVPDEFSDKDAMKSTRTINTLKTDAEVVVDPYTEYLKDYAQGRNSKLQETYNIDVEECRKGLNLVEEGTIEKRSCGIIQNSS